MALMLGWHGDVHALSCCLLLHSLITALGDVCRYPLQQVPEAMAALLGRKVQGKVIVTMDSSSGTSTISHGVSTTSIQQIVARFSYKQECMGHRSR